MVEDDFRAACPGVGRALHHEGRLLLGRAAPAPVAAGSRRPCRAGVVVPDRYATLVQPDGTLEAVTRQHRLRVANDPAAAPGVAVVVDGRLVEVPVVGVARRVLGENRQRVRQPVVFERVDVGQPGEHHLRAGVGLVRRQVGDLEQPGVVGHAAAPEHVQVRLVPDFPDGDVAAIALDRRVDEGRPRVAGVDRLAGSRRIAAVAEDRRAQVADAGPVAGELGDAEQDGVDLQVMGAVVLHDHIVAAPVELAGAALDPLPVQRPAVPGRAQQQRLLVARLVRRMVGRRDEGDAEPVGLQRRGFLRPGGGRKRQQEQAEQAGQNDGPCLPPARQIARKTVSDVFGGGCNHALTSNRITEPK